MLYYVRIFDFLSIQVLTERCTEARGDAMAYQRIVGANSRAP